MGSIASQITSLTIVYSIVYSDADQRKHQKLRVTGFCEGNSPGTGEFPAQMASNVENVSIWWRHHVADEYIRASDYVSIRQSTRWEMPLLSEGKCILANPNPNPNLPKWIQAKHTIFTAVYIALHILWMVTCKNDTLMFYLVF